MKIAKNECYKAYILQDKLVINGIVHTLADLNADQPTHGCANIQWNKKVSSNIRRLSTSSQNIGEILSQATSVDTELDHMVWTTNAKTHTFTQKEKSKRKNKYRAIKRSIRQTFYYN